MTFEMILKQLTMGFGQTCLIFALTLLFSLPLGMVVYFGRSCKFKPDNYNRFVEWGYDFEFANMKFMDVSSTVIRHRVKTGKPLGSLVTQPVLEYIRKNGLYLPYND